MDNKLRCQIYATGDYKSLTETSKRVFQQVMAYMDEKGILKLADTAVMAAYARNVVLARLASIDIEKYGVMITQEDKYHGTIIKENPAVGVMQRAQRAYEDSALKLGLTPAGRKKVTSGDDKDKNELSEWL